MLISKGQAADFAMLTKDLIVEICNTHQKEYIFYLESIKDSDKQAKEELVALLAKQREPPPNTS